MMLILSGTFGYTLIRHTCQSCGTDEIIATVAVSPDEGICYCTHDAITLKHHHSHGEITISDDCCTHESERLVIDDLVRTEVQLEITPFAESSAIAFTSSAADILHSHFDPDESPRLFYDLTSFYCKLQS
jgi:hypothetical protein